MSEPNRQKQARSLALIALMVLSVTGGLIGFAGGAAAASAPSGASQATAAVHVADSTPGASTNISTVSKITSIGNSQDISQVKLDFNGASSFSNGFQSSPTVNVTVYNNATARSNGVVKHFVSTTGTVPNGQKTLTSQSFSSLSVDNGSSGSGQDIVVVNVTTASGSFKNPSALGNYTGNLEFNPQSSSSWNSPGVTLTVSQPTFHNSTASVTNANATVNVSVTDSVNIAEHTINVSAHNTNTGKTYTLVQNGAVKMGSKVSSSTFTNGNSTTELVNLSVPLPEGHYTLNASAANVNGKHNSVSGIGSGFTVNMAGKSLKVVPDNSNPLAGHQAHVSAVAVDKNGNRLIFNDSNVGTNGSNIHLTYSDPNNVTNTTLLTSSNQKPIWNVNKQQYNTTFGVNYSQVGQLKITASDFSGNLTSGSATQTYTAQVKGAKVASNTSTLVADGSHKANVTLQLVDQNGNPVSRKGVKVSWGITSGNQRQAGVTTVSKTTSTNSKGQAHIVYNASNSGYTVTVSGQTSNYADTASFNTTAGAISKSNSKFTVDGSTSGPASKPQVATQHNLSAHIVDAQKNPIAGQSVTFTANGSTIATVSTNAHGYANTTYTLPTTAKTTVLNASAGAFNGSTGASVSVSSKAANLSQLAFASSTRTLPANTKDTVKIQGLDKYGNVNTSASPKVTLTSSNKNVFSLGGSNTTTNSASSGVASFSVATNASGSATLAATVTNPNVSNVSDTFTVGTAKAIKLTVNHNMAASDVSDSHAKKTATITAQLLDGHGNPIAIPNENISFARKSGSSAVLNQARSSYTTQTNASGVATMQVNATKTPGSTQFIALAENYSAQGTVNTQTTGASDHIKLTPMNRTLSQNQSTNVTASFVDSQGRIVPRSGQQIQLSTSGGKITSAKKKSTTFNANGRATTMFTFNASNAKGSVNLTAIGGGVAGSTTLSVTAPSGHLSTSYRVSNTTVSPGSYVTIAANVTNTGKVNGTQNVTFSADGHQFTTKSVSVAAGQSKTVTASTSFRYGGVHNVSVNNQAATQITVTTGGSASVTFNGKLVRKGTHSVTVASATLPEGGFIVIHNATQLHKHEAIKSIRGHSGYLSAGTHHNVTISISQPITANTTLVAMDHMDTNNNQTDDFVSSNGSIDTPYTMNGSAVVNSAQFTVLAHSQAPVVVGNTPAKTYKNSSKYLDVNGDGKLNIVDVQAFFAHRNQIKNMNSSMRSKFDFNGNGKIDIGDVQKLFHKSQTSS